MSETTAETQLPAVRVAPELDQLARLGRWLALAESESKDPAALGAAAALRFYWAEHLELTPLAAAELSMIRGRLVVSAKLVRALARKRGFSVLPEDGSDVACTAVLVDEKAKEIGRVTYTIEQAKRAGLVKDGSGWQKNPERMLWARASKRVVDDFAPDVSLGLLTEEEAAEFVEGGGRADRVADVAASTAAGPPADQDADVIEGEAREEPEPDTVPGFSRTAPSYGPDTPEPEPGPEPEPEPDTPVKTDPHLRRTIFAIIGKLANLGEPPGGAPTWKDYTEERAGEWFGESSLGRLKDDEAGKLIDAMDQYRRELQAAAGGEQKPEPADPEADDIPF